MNLSFIFALLRCGRLIQARNGVAVRRRAEIHDCAFRSGFGLGDRAHGAQRLLNLVLVIDQTRCQARV